MLLLVACVCFLALPHVCLAYVDTYNYKFPICSATIKEIGNVAYSFYDKKDLLLANYKGDKADQCKGNINTAWMRVVIQSKMMAVVGEVQSIDSEMFQSSQRCRDVSCIAEACKNGVLQLKALQTRAGQEFLTITNNRLSKMKASLEKCIAQKK